MFQFKICRPALRLKSPWLRSNPVSLSSLQFKREKKEKLKKDINKKQKQKKHNHHHNKNRRNEKIVSDAHLAQVILSGKFSD